MPNRKSSSAHGLPGGALGLAGSRNSSLRDKIIPLPDYVQEAMERSFGRSSIPSKQPLPPRKQDQFDYCGGEARRREEEEARALEDKLNGKPQPQTSATSSSHTFSSSSSKRKLKSSISAEGLAQCLKGHDDAAQRILSIEAACKRVRARPVAPHLLNLLASPKRSLLSSTSSSSTESIQKSAKKSWGKLRNAVRGGFGMATAAAQTKAVSAAMASIEENGTKESTMLALQSISDGGGSRVAEEMMKKKKKKKVRRVITPRTSYGGLVPPWLPSPNAHLPTLKVVPRDVAILRVCQIPREWAEQWLSGHDVEEPRYSPSSTSVSSAGSKSSRKVKQSAMSFDDARHALPHSHTFLFHHTGRFVTTVINRSRLLEELREHPMGPSLATLKEVVARLKAERPEDGGPSGATFDRRAADGVIHKQPPRAVISHGLVGSHVQALEREVQMFVGPGPGAHLLQNGFGTKTGTFRPASTFSTTNHYDTISLTMLKRNTSSTRECEQIGPGAAAYNIRNSQGGNTMSTLGGDIGRSESRFQLHGERGKGGELLSYPAPHDYDVSTGWTRTSVSSSKGGVIAGKDKGELERQLIIKAREPGPSDYRPFLAKNMSAPKFSTTFALSELDLVMLRSSETPGPGLYYGGTGGVPKNPNVQDGGRAPKFSSGNYPSDLDIIIARSSSMPGASAYKPKFQVQSKYHSNPSQMLMRLPFNSETMAESELRRLSKLPGPPRYSDAYMTAASERLNGGKFSTAYPPSALDTCILNASRNPGPVDYQPTTNKTKFQPGPYGAGLGTSKKTNGAIISKSKIPTMTEQAMINGSRQPFWVHDQGDDKKIKASVGGNVGRISTANPKSDVEWMIDRAKDTPGPSEYDVPNGMADNMNSRNNGKMSTSFVPSDLEKIIEVAKKRPGPSQYNVKDVQKRVAGIKFSTSIAPREVERLMRDAAMLPGPVDYQPITYNLPRS